MLTFNFINLKFDFGWSFNLLVHRSDSLLERDVPGKSQKSMAGTLAYANRRPVGMLVYINTDIHAKQIVSIRICNFKGNLRKGIVPLMLYRQNCATLPCAATVHERTRGTSHGKYFHHTTLWLDPHFGAVTVKPYKQNTWFGLVWWQFLIGQRRQFPAWHRMWVKP